MVDILIWNNLQSNNINCMNKFLEKSGYIYPFKQSTLPCQKKSYLKALRNVRKGARFSILPIYYWGECHCCHSLCFDLNFKLYPSPFALVQFIHLGERVPLSPSRKSFHRHSTGKGKNPADFPYFLRHTITGKGKGLLDFSKALHRKRKKFAWFSWFV